MGRQGRRKRRTLWEKQSRTDHQDGDGPNFGGHEDKYAWMDEPKSAQMFARIESRLQGVLASTSDKSSRIVLDEVFDHQTLLALYKLMQGGHIDTLEHVIARGKEAHVFWGESDDGPVAVKIFHTSNAVFKNLVQYIEGDPRFGGLKRKRRDLVTIWVRKEHRNAIRMRKAGVRVPKPLACHRNVLVMEHIGDPTSSAPRLQSVTVPNPPDILDELVESVSKIWHHAKLVHADLSPYNVLMHNGLPWIIDVGQSVSIRHPRAEEWLIRDVEKLVHWANKCGLVTSLEEILAHVLEGVGLKSGDSEE